MDGFEVKRIADAAKDGDIFVTVTGDKHVIALAHILKMKDGAIIANSGHFNVEIAVDELAKRAKSTRKIRDYVDEYTLPDGSRRFVLAQGRLINLSAAEGHPAEVMDMSFANQALAAEFFVQNRENLSVKVYTISAEMDREIARLKLVSMGIKFDTLTHQQNTYLGSWEEGT